MVDSPLTRTRIFARYYMETKEAKEETLREEEEVEAERRSMKYALGLVEISVIRCAIELGIPDLLERRGGPMDLHEICQVLGCHQPTLHRIMRFVVHLSVFKEVPALRENSTAYAQTALSRRFVRKGEKSIAPLLMLNCSQEIVSSWNFLSSHALTPESGTRPFEAANGGDLWQCAAARPSFGRLFDEGMACQARCIVSSLIERGAEVFEGIASMVDVGGGNGTTLAMLIQAFPWIEGTNFDLPHVVDAAPKCLRVRNVSGNMFNQIPPANAILLMRILHNWSDEECVVILKNCKQSIIGSKGKVIIVDAAIAEHELQGLGLMMDMQMLAVTKGRERTWKEWKQLLEQAEFSSYSVTHIRDVESLIQAYP